MTGAIIGLVLGAIGMAGIVMPIPPILPVIGLALGANAFVKESRKEEPNGTIRMVSAVAMVLSGFPTLMFVLKRLV